MVWKVDHRLNRRSRLRDAAVVLAALILGTTFVPSATALSAAASPQRARQSDGGQMVLGVAAAINDVCVAVVPGCSGTTIVPRVYVDYDLASIVASEVELPTGTYGELVVAPSTVVTLDCLDIVPTSSGSGYTVYGSGSFATGGRVTLTIIKTNQASGYGLTSATGPYPCGATGETWESAIFAVFDLAGSDDPNEPPTASFTYDCNGLTCNFDAEASSDSDGTITDYAWDFGDGSSGSGVTPSYSYPGNGTYQVTLTVTDNEGATSSATQEATVSAGTAQLTLSATGQRKGRTAVVELTWSGATTTHVNIYRNGALLARTANDGAHTDKIANASGSYTYRVCEADTTSCSNEATATF